MKEKTKVKSKSRLRKINPVDAVIAIVFLLSLMAMVYLFTGVVFSESETSEETSVTEVEYRLMIPNVNIDRFELTVDEVSGTVECSFLKIGDVLYNSNGSEQLGELVSIQYEVSTASTGHTDSEGNLIYAECPRQIDLILTVRGKQNVNTLTIGGEAIRVGKELEFHTPSYYAVANIVSIDREVE